MTGDAEMITLDTSAEPWVGTFPGLGSVRVFADGTFDVVPVGTGGLVSGPLAGVAAVGDEHGREEEDDEDVKEIGGEVETALADERRRALTHGWAEPLSWARQGYTVASGTALVEPESGLAVLAIGRSAPQVVVVRSLIDAGWPLLTDAITPIDDVSGVPHVVPTGAPLLMPAAALRDSGVSFERARTDTDAVIVPVKRASEPVRLAALLICQDFNVGDVAEVTSITGVEKMSRILGAQVGGVLATHDEPEQDFARLTARASIAVGTISEGHPELDAPRAVREWMKALVHG